ALHGPRAPGRPRLRLRLPPLAIAGRNTKSFTRDGRVLSSDFTKWPPEEAEDKRRLALGASVNLGVAGIPVDGLLDLGDPPAGRGAYEGVSVRAVGIETLAVLRAEAVNHSRGYAGRAISVHRHLMVGAEV